MKLMSKSFFNDQFIPLKFCRHTLSAGQNISPQFSWNDYPQDTKSFVLTFIDRHPKAKNWVHWILVDIPVSINNLLEGASKSSKMPSGILELANTFGLKGYDGPQPPKGSGRHNYEAIIYALNIEKTGLSGQVDENKLLKKIQPHILSQANIVGLFDN